MSSDIENKCIKKGVRLTDQRKLVAQVMSESDDHPDVKEPLPVFGQGKPLSIVPRGGHSPEPAKTLLFLNRA